MLSVGSFLGSFSSLNIYSFLKNFHDFHLSDNTLPTHLSISKLFHGYSFILVNIGNGTNVYGVLDAFYILSLLIFIDVKIFVPIK